MEKNSIFNLHPHTKYLRMSSKNKCATPYLEFDLQN